LGTSILRFWTRVLKDIGKHFGIREFGLSQACQPVSQNFERDKKLKIRIGKIENN
jgi:hypothetical protein